MDGSQKPANECSANVADIDSRQNSYVCYLTPVDQHGRDAWLSPTQNVVDVLFFCLLDKRAAWGCVLLALDVTEVVFLVFRAMLHGQMFTSCILIYTCSWLHWLRWPCCYFNTTFPQR